MIWNFIFVMNSRWWIRSQMKVALQKLYILDSKSYHRCLWKPNASERLWKAQLPSTGYTLNAATQTENPLPRRQEKTKLISWLRVLGWGIKRKSICIGRNALVYMSRRKPLLVNTRTCRHCDILLSFQLLAEFTFEFGNFRYAANCEWAHFRISYYQNINSLKWRVLWEYILF